MDKEQATITVPASFIDRLATAGRLMLELAEDLRAQQPHMDKLQPPEVIPEDQAWFWSDTWQAGERAVEEDLERGEYATFDSIDALLADLHATQ